MSLFVLEAVRWTVGIRGHIPHDDGFPGGGGKSPTANAGPLMRLLAAAAVSVVLLSLVLWAAAWLAIRLL
jgi:hypothetical protein